MTIKHWNGANGDWSLYFGWSPNGAPGGSDDAFIDLVTGTPYDVTVNSAESALSLTVNSADATLDINNALTIGTTLSVTAGTVNLNTAGTIVGGTVIGSGIVFNRGTLSGVEYQGTLDLSAASARVHIGNGITLTGAGGSGPGDVQLTGDSSHIYLRGNQTLDNAAISLGGATANASIDQIGGGTLTLGTSLTITHAGKYAQIYGVGAKIINAGTIDAGLSAGRFSLVGSSFVNQGLIGISNADVFRVITQTFSNAGTISLASGGELHFTTKMSQTDPNRSIGYISNTGGTIFIERNFYNAGAVLTTGVGGLGTVVLEGTSGYGSIIGGTVTGSGMVFQDGTLSGVTYAGLLDLSASGAKVNVRNGITLTDTIGPGPGNARLTGNGSQMYFYGTETLDSASIDIGSASGAATLRQAGGGGTLTLGPNLAITNEGQSLLYIASSNTVINTGSIEAGVSGGRFVVYGGRYSGNGRFTNTGAISVSNGDFFQLNVGGGFSNQGSITVASGAVLQLASNLATNDLGALTNSGGTVSINATLDNTGSVLPTGAGGNWGTVALTGQIVGGTITGSGIRFVAGGMSGVNFVGPLDLSPDGSQTAITNGISLVGAGGSGPGSVLLTGSSSYLIFSGTQTLDNASVSIGGDVSYASLREFGGTLGLGSNLSITQNGAFAYIYVQGGSAITNSGAINVGQSGGRLRLEGNGYFVNQGNVNVFNGGTFRSDSTVSGSGTFTVNGNAYLLANDVFANTQTIDFTGSAGHLVLPTPASFHAGIVGFQNGDTVDFRGIGLADHTGYSSGVVTLYDNVNAVLAQATLSTPTPAPSFTLGNDGYGGTVLGLASSVPGPVFYSTTAGVYLYYPSIQNPATIASAATITNTTAAHNGDAVYGISPTAWTLFNYGTISATQSGARGVLLEAGGAVFNGTYGNTGEVITGDRYGVGIFGGAGSVANYGTIAGTGGAGYGIILAAGGRIDSGEFAGTALISGFHAIDIRGGIGTVFNDGTITGNGLYNYGVRLRGGGDLVNGSAGLITGDYAVAIRTGGGTLTNYGTIAGIRGGAYLTGGAVQNGYYGSSGVLLTGYYGVFSYAGINVTNYGTISGTATNTIYGTGVNVGAGSTVTNNQSGLITGYDGVRISGPNAILTNLGTIVSTGTGFAAASVIFSSGGTLANYGTILGINTYASGIVAGLGNDLIVNGEAGGATAIVAGWLHGIDQFTGVGTVVNYGTISSSYGDGVDLQAGGTVVNGSFVQGALITGYGGVRVSGPSARLTNFGTIASTGSGFGAQGVDFLSVGTLTNNGTIAGINTYASGINAGFDALIYNSAVGGGTATIAGWLNGIDQFSGTGTVVNNATISSSHGDAVYLQAGGTVSNFGGYGLISGYVTGVHIAGGAGLVVNTGSIAATSGNAVYFAGGGTVNNLGHITGHSDVVEIRIDGLVLNSGTIAASAGTGIWLPDGGNVTNHGLVTGTDDVIFTGYTAGTVFNDGTISDTGAYGAGVCLDAGGVVTNGLTGIILGVDKGIEANNDPASVTNAGTVAATGAGGSGIALFAGGSIGNSGLISGGLYGVLVGGPLAISVFNTGNGSTTDGYADPHWQFTNSGGTTGNALVANNPGVDFFNGGPPWYPDSSSSSWIVDNVTGAPSGGNPLSFFTTFDLSGFDPATATVSGSWSVDDQGVLELNGHVIASITAQGDWGALHPFSAAGSSGYFLPGINTLSVVLSVNDNFFEGANVRASATATPLSSNAVSNSGTIAGYAVGVMLNGFGSVSNLGTIEATGAASNGVRLSLGGSVVNGGIAAPAALISGASAIKVYGGAGTITNYASIVSSTGYAAGVYLAAGGNITNLPGGLVQGPAFGALVGSAAGNIVNFGTIVATGTDGTGIWLIAGGSVTNADTAGFYGYIQGYDGVVTGSNLGTGVGTVVNEGSIAGVNVGVWLAAGGTAVNYGAISATVGDGVVTGSYGGGGGVGGVLNYGAISGPVIGVLLAAGGSVGNYGTIASGNGVGVDIDGGAGTVVNYGAITGGAEGVWLEEGGTVVNFTTIANSGTYGRGIRISSYGGPGYIRNLDLISGPTAGVLASAPTRVVNYGTIAGTGSYGDGVDLIGYPGTVVNYGTVSGTQRGVYLGAGGSVANLVGGVIASQSGVGIDGAGTVTNYGTIAGSARVGVFLGQGGSVINGAGTATGALIAGTTKGIIVYGTTASVTNFGTIAASVSYQPAIYLVAGGSVYNKASGLIQGGGDGAVIGSGAGIGVGTVTNLGTIDGVNGAGVKLVGGGIVVNGPAGAAAISGGSYGVVLINVGGTVINGASGSTGAVIDGGYHGVFARDGASTVGNYGTITSGGGAGVLLNGGGFALNAYGALIVSGGDGVRIANAAGALSNAGTVVGGHLGVYITAGGSVFNGQAGTITGGAGIRILGAGTVTNYGSVIGITAYTGVGVDMDGGVLLNGAATATSAAIVGGRGVQVYGAAGTVTNFGTIAGSYINASAIDLDAGGVIDNRLSGLIQGAGDGISIGNAGAGAATVTNRGTIVGVSDTGIVLAGGGTIVNGPGGATGALIAGGVAGIVTAYLPVTIVNYGTIADTGYTGILALAGGSLFNSRLVTGYQYGANVKGAAGTVVNSGTMIATGTGGSGVNLQAGGAVDNSGTIAGGRNGIFFDAATSISNHGLISGSGVDGVYAGAGAGVVNNYGTIAALGAGGTGVRLVGGSTLFNAGTIAGGGLSVYFIGGNNRLVVAPSAVFVGNVDASLGAGDTLELAIGIGSLAGFGSSFIGFEQLAVDPASIWQLTGPVTLGGGFIVTDAGALDFGGALTNDGSLEIEAGAVLSFTGTVGGAGGIDFNGANGTLVIGVPSGMSNAISGFAPTDRIDLVGIGLAAAYTYSGGILRLLNGGGGQIAQLTLSTPVTNPHFTLSNDASTGTMIGISAPTGTFTGSYFHGIVLSDPTIQNPATITSTAYVTNYDIARYNGDAVFGTSAASWYLLNQGLVTTNPTLANAVGVRFQAGGTIANSATIIGSINGVVIDGAAGTVANGGIIAASDAATGAGIALHAGGSVSNAIGATISGFNNGVFVSGGTGAVANAGTIHSSTASAVYLTQGGQVRNLATGLIEGGVFGILTRSLPAAIDNSGTITSTGNAVYLYAGGAITNQQSGLIAGGNYGVVVDTSNGIVTNLGTIVGAGDTGVELVAGGTIVNGPGGATGATIIGGAVGVGLVAPATVVNDGTIAGGSIAVRGLGGSSANAGTIHSDTAGGNAAVYFGQGGQVSNLATGLITAYRTAVSIKGAAGYVVNYGTIQGAGTSSDGVYLSAGGSVTNGRTDITTALIQSGGNGVDVRNAIGTVANFGTIAALGTHTAIYFGNAGGSVFNGASNSSAALISSNLASAIHFHTVAGTVVNYGTLLQTGQGTSGQGVYLGGGGLAINGLTGLISSYHSGISAGFGQYGPPAATTVINAGTIVSNGATSGAGVNIGGGGTIVNGTGGVIAAYRSGISATGAAAIIVNAGIIEHLGAGTAGSAIYLGAGGVVTNYGLVSGARAGTSSSNGYPGAVQAHNQRATVFNFGTITNPNDSNGVNLGSGGLMINGAGGFGTALIAAPHAAVYMGGTLGVPTAGAVGTVVNYGTIQNSTSLAPAVSLASGGTAINFGLVSSARTGIAFGNPGGVPGTIDNFGTIVSTAPLAGTRGSGAYLGYGGILTNRAGGLITAERAAVSLAGAGATAAGAIVTNYGVLSGSTGLSIGAGDIGDNTIVNFGTIAGTSGIAILLGSGNDQIVIESSSYLNGAVSNFQIGDSFDLPFLVFSASETVARDPGNVLRISQSGTLVYSINLDPAQNFGSNQFRVANDGFGGTLVLEGPDATPPVTLTRVLAVNANSSATPIGIPAPTDPDDLSAALTVNVAALPSDGTVVLADGVTAVTLGQGLTVSQLTGLEFIPTAGLIGQTSTFTYTASDPAGNVSNQGTAFLGINLAPPPNSPSLVNGLGGPEGFGENALAPNDDGSSSAIDITSVFGSGLRFFGQTYNSLFVNNNGNITFNAALSAFTPGPITAGLGNPIIAAFWADVDTRGGPGVPTGGNATGSNTVYWDLDPVNHALTVTWDDVGYFSGHTDKLDAFQLQLIDEGNGDFDIVFRYQAIYWTTGDASGGSNGFGGSVARSGFSAGDGLHAYELPQSGNQNAMLGLDSNPAPAGTQGVTNQIGVYRFEVRNGIIHPEAPTNLALASDSDNIPPNNNHTTDPTPTVTGQGITGDTVTVLADGNAVGSGIVQSNGAWSVTLSTLAVGAHSLTATQANPAGDVSQPSAALPITIDPPPQPLTTQLFDFLFTYNDGKDYYFGTVFDSGNFGYQLGQTITFGAGHYQIVAVETSAIAQATGTVSVSLYSHGGVGQAAPTPVKTGQGLADGTAGLGTETDSILGIDGDLHAFSGAVEVSFQTTDLWGFIYTYADGRAFYTGTVASANTLNGFNVTDGSGNLVGTYSVFKQGQTTRANNTVVVDRFTLNGLAFIPVHSGVSLVNGQGGLGTEQGQISVNGALLTFSDRVEPAATVSQPTLPLTPPPSAGDVIAAEVNALYREVLGRNPDPSGFATFTAQLAGGASVASVRTTLAQSSEAQNDLNQLYHQIFGRNIDASGAVAYTNALINGSSLATIQLLLAQSPEAQSAIQLIYQQVLGRAADGGGLTAYMAAIGNPTAPMSLADVRSTVAHSPEAADDLSRLVVNTLGRTTFAAELVGMENEIATDGKTQQTLQSELLTRNTAGTYTVVSDPNGSSLLGAQAGVPTLFLFSDVSLASDTIVGFDPTRDTIQLPTSIATDFQAVQSHMTTSQFGGTLIHFSSSQEIAIDKVAPSSLGGTNFRFG